MEPRPASRYAPVLAASAGGGLASLALAGALGHSLQVVLPALVVVAAGAVAAGCLAVRLGRLVSLAFITGAVVADAYSTGYGLGAGLVERGLLASAAVEWLGPRLGGFYFLLVEYTVAVVIYTVVGAVARGVGRPLASEALSVLAASLGPATAAIANMGLLGG